ncbi:IS1182 family transposase [Tissierella sp. MB52-C2]|uniref:IS1182 family transposase n=1 Tax=Tissierella sp. MB52-C2 TaxID=3070999 RepID=UPI00280B06B2|nr:IS1182 family transposase [Tissierella sp. MB52-C2]WMM25898.1 IS1182 family transposase [Tissierella sp. MB52-C2]WMM26806.1 IS1182 family transposase [Tissierella sp. MB52-C2]
MLKKQMEMILSTYSEIYNLIIPKDNILRKINEMIDFSFVYDELITKYSPDNGRGAIDPLRMFKYLLLKVIYDLSDIDVVERSRYDMSFKYFLNMAPEEDVINPSSLTKFRKQRLKDINLLDLLIGKTVEIALEEGIIKSNSIIVDSTHTKARYNQKSQREILLEYSKKLRKSVYEIDDSIKKEFPPKVNSGILEDEIQYCKKLISVVENNEIISQYPKVKEKMNLLKELIEDDLEMLEYANDKDAKVGHKTADTSFFGYKTHLALTGERIITAATITSGEKHDGKQLKDLVEKSRKNGIEVNEVIGDTAYSEKDNIKYAKEEKFRLISKLNPTVAHGNRKNEDKFEYNKDAGMYVCKAGHMAIRKARQGKKGGARNQVNTYYFDIEKCKCCSHKDGCYKEGAKTKSYSVSIKSVTHQEQMNFQETEYFKERVKERYKIEAKNSELKHRHGYDIASSSCLIGMELQGALTIFAVNLKRIIALIK